MDTHFYALVKQSDGTYELAVSDKLRAEIASIIANKVIRIEDVKAFDEFQAKRAPAWDYSEALYREEAEIDKHPFWWALADLAELSLGRCNKKIVNDVFYVYGLDETYGFTDDKITMLAILGQMFDHIRASQMIEILDAIQWA